MSDNNVLKKEKNLKLFFPLQAYPFENDLHNIQLSCQIQI